MSTLPDIRVGDPIRHAALSVFPLFTPSFEGVDYLLADEAIAAGSVVVEEVSEGGSVPYLLVTNKGDRRVLFLEGEELRGAKQNRVLNTSVLIAALAKTSIPVSCVEHGRWRYRSRQFESSGSHSSSKLRGQLKKSVSSSLRSGHGHHSDQGAVWHEVGRQMEALSASSETEAMADTYEAHHERLAEFQKHLDYVEGATGIAVAVGDKVVAVDLFDKPSTCGKVWNRLLTGVVMDALEADQAAPAADRVQVEQLLDRLRGQAWEPAPPVGEGQEFRYDDESQTHGSALMFGDAVLHGSVVVAG